MALDMPTVPNDEIEEAEMPPATVAFHTFALPLRLGAPSSSRAISGSVEQQHDSTTLLIQDQDGDMRMRLD